MATTLRELIAKVVFRADPTQLKAFNDKLDDSKKKLDGVEKESKEAAAALRGVGSGAKGAIPAVAGLSGGIGGLYKLLGGLGAAALAYKAINFAQNALEEADAVGDLAFRLGISTNALQVWTALVEQADGSSDDLTVAVKTLANNMQTVAQTAKGPASDALKRLGISTEGWSKELPNTIDILTAVGGALGDLENDTERLTLAQDLLGKGALNLLPSFKGGTAALKEHLDSLKDVAVVYSEEFIASAAEANDEMDLFGRQLKGVGVQVVLGVVPALRSLMRWLMPVITTIRNVVRDSNALNAALTMLGGFGVAFLSKHFSKLGAILRAAGGIFLKFILPFLVLDDVITFLRGGKSVIGDIIEALFGVGSAAAVLETIRDAWQEVEVAAGSLWSTLGLVIQRTFGLGEAGKLTADEFESAFIKASTGIADVFDALFGGIGAAFSGMLDGWRYAAEAFFGWILQKLLSIPGAKALFGSTDGAKLGAGVEEREYRAGGATVQDIRKDKAMMDGLRAQDAMRNAQAGLALGGSPTVAGAKSTTVTMNDNSSITSHLNGVDAKNVGAALRQTERNISAELKRTKAQVLRQTVGASGV